MFATFFPIDPGFGSLIAITPQIPIPTPAPYHWTPKADQKWRKRIGWLNGEAGGFEGTISYDKVAEVAEGLACSAVMQVLKNIENKNGDINDPTAWICTGLRKAGGGHASSPDTILYDQVLQAL